MNSDVTKVRTSSGTLPGGGERSRRRARARSGVVPFAAPLCGRRWRGAERRAGRDAVDSTRVPFGGLATPRPTGPSSTPLGTPLVPPGGGSAVADAELTVARRRAADLEKREQRLMTAFKRDLRVPRIVRLLFGYKVDMSVDESAESGANACVATLRPQFTLHADDEDERHVLRFAVERSRAWAARRARRRAPRSTAVRASFWRRRRRSGEGAAHGGNVRGEVRPSVPA